MGAVSNIEWCDSTFNPWRGCTKVSPACDNCYAEALVDTRLHQAKWGAGNPRVRTSAHTWKRVEQWNRTPFFECDCGYRGTMEDLTTNAIHACNLQFRRTRRRVFCASLADVFDNDVDPQWRDDLFDLIYRTPGLDWLLLTKRIGNVAKMLGDIRFAAEDGHSALDFMPLMNVWLGATVANQFEAKRDIPKLCAIAAKVRFLSIEPMLSAIELDAEWLSWPCADLVTGYRWRSDGGIDWVIAGGESGPHARPAHPDWFRALRDQCARAEVPFMFKQWGEWVSVSEVEGDGFHHHFQDGATVRRVGKKVAGRSLDGVVHNGVPK